MNDKPRVRPVEAFPVQQDGKTLVYLKDPLNFATPLGISPAGYFVLVHFDGQHSFTDVQEAYCKQFGSLLMSDDLKSFVDMLDQHYYLDSERFRDYKNAVVLEFRSQTTRAPAHVGGVYKADPEELKTQLEGFFSAPSGPGLPNGQVAATTPRAIVAPHIDFHRGGPAYAGAYKPFAESVGGDLFILLGTSHFTGDTSCARSAMWRAEGVAKCVLWPGGISRSVSASLATAGRSPMVLSSGLRAKTKNSSDEWLPWRRAVFSTRSLKIRISAASADF